VTFFFFVYQVFYNTQQKPEEKFKTMEHIQYLLGKVTVSNNSVPLQDSDSDNSWDQSVSSLGKVSVPKQFNTGSLPNKKQEPTMDALVETETTEDSGAEIDHLNTPLVIQQVQSVNVEQAGIYQEIETEDEETEVSDSDTEDSPLVVQQLPSLNLLPEDPLGPIYIDPSRIIEAMKLSEPFFLYIYELIRSGYEKVKTFFIQAQNTTDTKDHAE